PKGYRGFEKQWEEVRNDPDKATELHLIPDLHCSNYCLARAPRDKVGIKPLPAELIDVSKKLAQAASELSQSSNESKSGVDPLIMVLGPEHGGRTRGVGCDIGYKKGVEGYVRKKRTSKQRKDNEEIRNEVRQQMKEELKSSDFWLEMRAELKDDELPYLESAVNGFIQWPIFAIGRYKGMSKPPVTEVPTKRLMPQHERAPSSKKGKVNDTLKNPTRRTKHLKIQPTNKNQYSG
nr:COP8-like protein [Tanacetum cinerariifolium]